MTGCVYKTLFEIPCPTVTSFFKKRIDNEKQQLAQCLNEELKELLIDMIGNNNGLNGIGLHFKAFIMIKTIRGVREN